MRKYITEMMAVSRNNTLTEFYPLEEREWDCGHRIKFYQKDLFALLFNWYAQEEELMIIWQKKWLQ